MDLTYGMEINIINQMICEAQGFDWSTVDRPVKVKMLKKKTSHTQNYDKIKANIKDLHELILYINSNPEPLCCFVW